MRFYHITDKNWVPISHVKGFDKQLMILHAFGNSMLWYFMLLSLAHGARDGAPRGKSVCD